MRGSGIRSGPRALHRPLARWPDLFNRVSKRNLSYFSRRSRRRWWDSFQGTVEADKGRLTVQPFKCSTQLALFVDAPEAAQSACDLRTEDFDGGGDHVGGEAGAKDDHVCVEMAAICKAKPRGRVMRRIGVGLNLDLLCVVAVSRTGTAESETRKAKTFGLSRREAS